MVEQQRKPQQAVGGQAIIEGVIMRTPESAALAVRTSDGGIVVRDKPWKSLTRRIRPLGWPFVRGMAVLIESMREGIEGLRFSAEIAVEQEQEAAGGEAQGTSGRATANLALVLGFAVALLLFKGVPHGAALLFGFAPEQTLFHLVDGVVKLALVVGYITLVSRMEDIQRVFQYHGAEHKSIRALEEGAPLEVAAVQPFSRLHERCGTSFIVVVVLTSVLVYIALSPLIPRGAPGGWLFQVALVLAKVLLLAPVAAISYEINRLAGRFSGHWWARIVAWPGMQMQRALTTREPSPDQLEVALVALRAAVALSDNAAGFQATHAGNWRMRRYDNFDAFMNQHGRDVPQDGLEAGRQRQHDREVAGGGEAVRRAGDAPL
jgi:uncharacterized protein YqhQ